MIIVNDSSTDDTWDKILSIKDSRVRKVNLLVNSGAYYARNVGMLLARGNYITTVDSDDISPVLLELIHNLVIGEDIASVNTHEIKKTLTEDQFNHLKKTENVSNCSICMENKKSNIELNCSHTFCKGCIKKWLTEKSNTCPTCRSEV